MACSVPQQMHDGRHACYCDWMSPKSCTLCSRTRWSTGPSTIQIAVAGWFVLLALTVPSADAALRQLTLDQYRVSLEAIDEPLVDVLERLGEQAGFEVVVLGVVADTVTLTLDAVPVDDAIRQLAGARSTIVGMSSGRDEQRGTVNAVWLFGEPEGVSGGSAGLLAQSGRSADRVAELGDPNAAVRAAAIEQLYALPEADAVERMGELLTRDPSLTVRSAALEALANVGGVKAYTRVTNALEDKDAGLRLRALDVLHDLAPEASISALAQTLFRDRDSAVQRRAAELLYEHPNAVGRQILDTALKEGDASVVVAVQALSP